MAGRLGFALPTVLIASMVMIMILVTAVSVTTSISSSLREQRYTKLATMAANAGTVMATACLNHNGGQAAWSDAKPLKPNTNCSGDLIPGQSAYVLEQDDVRTYFEVGQPLLGAGNVPISAASKGFSEVLRTSSGEAWRVWSSDRSVVLASSGDGLPVGSVIDGFWTSAPAGYLLTDGAAVSRTTYANLFAVIGTTYGAGDGSTTFNLPDTRGRVGVNESSSGTFDEIGEVGGEEAHVLTIDELARHRHNFVYAGREYSNYKYGDSWNVSGGIKLAVDTTSHGSGTSISYVGNNAPHNNLQPYIVVNRAIKY